MGQVTSHIAGFFGDQSGKTSSIEDSKSENYIPQKKYTRKETKNESNLSSYFPFGILATPRNPLKRLREVSPKVSIPQSILDIFSPAKKAKIEEEFLDFTFLDENETIEYYKKSKIMIILRGLPGSGKSTIAKHIQRRYLSSKICSADNFFMKDGEYVYDRTLIRDAHAQCQENAIKAVQEQTSLVIIDNTNLKRWEMKFYLDLARSFSYIPVIVESKTPWRTDVSILVCKTVHDIDESILELKKNDFEELLPIYYGWFLNEKDSYLFLDEGRMWIEIISQNLKFMKEIKLYTGIQSLEDLMNFYEPWEKRILHCTAKFIGKNLTPENKKYIEKCESLVGKASALEVIGFVLTPRTFGARLKLSEQQLILWGNDDSEEVPQEFWEVPAEEEEEENDLQDQEEATTLINGTDDNVSIVNDKEPEEDKQSDPLNNSEIRDTSESSQLPHTNGIDNDDNINSSVGNTLAYLKKLTNSPDRQSIETTNISKENSLMEVKRLEKSWEISPSPKKRNYPINEISPSPKKRNYPINEISPSPKKRNYPINGLSPFKRSPRKQKGGIIIPENTLTIDETVTRDTITLHTSSVPYEDRFAPTQGIGSRAHFTVGCSPDVQPVTTGLDLIFAIKKEEMSIEAEIDPSRKEEVNGDSDPDSARNFHESVVEGATIRNYGNGVLVIYLDESIKVKSVFSAFY